MTVEETGTSACTVAEEAAQIAATLPSAPQSCRRDIGLVLSVLLREYHHASASVFAELPGGPRGFQVLLAAREAAAQGGRNQAALAAQLGLDRTVMTYLLDELVAAGLVERQPDPADRRARLIVLTGKGEETLTRLGGQLRELERSLFKALDDDEMDQLTGFLSRAGQTWMA